MDQRLGVGVVRVVLRVVEVGRTLDLGPRRQAQRLDQAVVALPAKVPVRHRQERLRLAVGVDRLVHEVLATQVHVRQETVKVHRLVELGHRLRLIVVGAGQNDQALLGDGAGLDLLLGRFLGEDQADRRAVRPLHAVGGVVHLEDQAGAFG